MIEAKAIFTLDGEDLTIQCNENDIMKDICQKYSNKIKRNINSLIFLYGGNQLNFNLKFRDVITDKDSKEMKIVVYSNENNEFICPKCGEKIKLNTEIIDNIILSINNLKETIDSAKIMLENVIKISSTNDINIQLKGINIILNTLSENIKKTKEKVKNLLNENKNNDNNYIIAKITINNSDANKDIRIINSYEECLRNEPDKYLKDEIFKNEDEIKNCEIRINDELIPFNYFYNFKSKGKYKIKYSFKNQLKNTCLLFQGCSMLTNIDLSSFNSNNITNMNGMFSGCSSLNSINFTNINTNKVSNMNSLFRQCSSLTNINLFNFNTDNITNMGGMFYECSSLKNINLSNFNTTNVTNMAAMFHGCSSLIDINLSNFNTNNVTNMRGMFFGCSSLIYINLSNFNTSKVTNMYGMFGKCKSLNLDNIIIKNRKILKDENLFKESSLINKKNE